jgi:hypothetical protein
MPIPGDNGNPKAEREAQERRIKEVAETGANVKSELRFNKPAPKEKTIFGKI